MRIEVIADGIVVGWSDFESGDPPMGAAFGILHTTPPGRRVEWATATLELRSVDGLMLDTSGVTGVTEVRVEDYREELDDEDAIEVSVVGLPRADYNRVFPEHLAAYKERFGE